MEAAKLQERHSGCRGVYLLTHPRSASNLFQTMLSAQPVHTASYFLFQASIKAVPQVRETPWDQLTPEDRKAIIVDYQSAFDKMLRFMDDAEADGKRCLIKEHAGMIYSPQSQPSLKTPVSEPTFILTADNNDSSTAPAHTNPSCLPDSFLLSMHPIFQIRSPLLMFPSMVRTQRKAGRGVDIAVDRYLTLRYTRELYEWYVAQSEANGNVAAPIIIDGDDVMKNPAAVRQLCLETGLDPDAVKYEWETRTVDNPVHREFLSTIATSTRILPGLDASGLSLETEQPKWTVEFGAPDAEVLADRVAAAMPDYEFLHTRRIGSKLFA